MKQAALCALAALFCATLPAQTPKGVVDLYIVNVKPEKRADFDTIAKKVAEINRKNKGDQWIAYTPEYGTGHQVLFSSVRDNFAAIDTASAAFVAAMKESLGPNFMKVFQDMNNCMLSSRGEIRRRRQDLSWNVPQDQEAIYQLVGGSKWVRHLTVRTRPGHTSEYEEAVKLIQSAFSKDSNSRPVFVSQTSIGQASGTYYFTSYAKAFADLDQSFNLEQLMGAENFKRYGELTRSSVLNSEWTMSRLLPELSNPPQQIVDANPDFWKPKPAMMPKPKAKAAPVPAKQGD